MDILAQYEKQTPEQKQAPQKIYEDSSEDHGPLIRWVMKISGGYVKEKKQANYVLIGFVAVAIVVSLIFIFGGTAKNILPPKIMDDTFNPMRRSIQN